MIFCFFALRGEPLKNYLHKYCKLKSLTQFYFWTSFFKGENNLYIFKTEWRVYGLKPMMDEAAKISINN
ncbi:MAG: hypothetical protein BGN92_05965 [Sphingobacteriales bacterium 41-5]|nr:MAG: hypothetical protein BGN92_05965 [Sphingobacteriales bacterium 41-5]